MAWYSILPSYLTVYEYWIARIFLVLAIINIAPWIIAIVYDIVLYVGRRMWHELPIWGGRARGEHRPRAPSLRERARDARSMSFTGMIANASGSSTGGRDEHDLRTRKYGQGAGHLRGFSSTSSVIMEEEEDENEKMDNT